MDILFGIIIGVLTIFVVERACGQKLDTIIKRIKGKNKEK